MQINNNKIKGLLLIGGIAIVGTVLLPQQASATTLLANFGTGENVYLNVDGTDVRDWAGSIKINVSGSNATALCVDLFDSMKVNQTYGTNLESSSTINNGGRVAWLMDTELPVLSSASDLAGLQLAIWDIVVDNGNGFSSGRVKAATQHTTDAAALSEANSLLALSVGKSSTDGIVYANYDLSSCTNVQTLMGVTGSPNHQGAVPEPQSVTMMALGGLAGLWLKLRRK